MKGTLAWQVIIMYKIQTNNVLKDQLSDSPGTSLCPRGVWTIIYKGSEAGGQQEKEQKNDSTHKEQLN